MGDFNQIAIFEFIDLIYHKILEPYHNSFKEYISPLQYYTLSVIKYNEKITMTHLADAMKMPKQNMTKIINKLIDEDLVERIKDPLDKRITWIVLSDKGNNLLLEILEINANKISNDISVLGKDKNDIFYDSMVKINNILKELNT